MQRCQKFIQYYPSYSLLNMIFLKRRTKIFPEVQGNFYIHSLLWDCFRTDWRCEDWNSVWKLTDDTTDNANNANKAKSRCQNTMQKNRCLGCLDVLEEKGDHGTESDKRDEKCDGEEDFANQLRPVNIISNLILFNGSPILKKNPLLFGHC